MAAILQLNIFRCYHSISIANKIQVTPYDLYLH
jgi:hypothetical protein